MTDGPAPSTRPHAADDSDALLTAILGAVADGVAILGDDGTVRRFNPAAERLFGRLATTVIGRSFATLIAPAFQSLLRGDLADLQRGVVSPSREVQVLRPDGTSVPLAVTLQRADVPAGAVVIAVLRDLTEVTRLRDHLTQAQKMGSVGSLTGGIAHDFNNLLTVILGASEELSAGLTERADLKRQADAVRSAAERGAELTQRLMAFSRRQAANPVAIDCGLLLRGMRQLLRRTLRENIEIRMSPADDVREIMADPVQFEAAVAALAIRAQDAMPNGGRLSIATADATTDPGFHAARPDVQPGQVLMLSVGDTGTADANKTADPATLDAAFSFALAAKGHVDIVSGPAGSTTRLFLPMVPEGQTAALLAAADEAGTARAGLVLVAEDDPFVRAYAVACLESLGYRVVAAVDGRDALARLAQGLEPDILFTDIVMPGGVNGWQLAEKAQAQRQSLKVLYTSGYAIETLADRGPLTPSTRILNKPYRRTELGRHIRELMAEVAADQP